jgi:hypothetical protein
MIRRYDGSNWVDIAMLRRWDGTYWVDVEFLRRYDGVNWVDLFSGKEKVLYDHGDEKVTVSGGWEGLLYHSSYTSGRIQKNADHIALIDDANSYGTWGIQNKQLIAVDGYTQVNFLVDITENYHISYSDPNRIFASISYNPLVGGWYNDTSKGIMLEQSLGASGTLYNQKVYSFPISLTGSRYIQFVPFALSYSNDKLTVKVYKIWLSK